MGKVIVSLCLSVHTPGGGPHGLGWGGTPIQPWMGVPPPEWDWYPPSRPGPAMGYPLSGSGPGMGCPPLVRTTEGVLAM